MNTSFTSVGHISFLRSLPPAHAMMPCPESAWASLAAVMDLFCVPSPLVLSAYSCTNRTKKTRPCFLDHDGADESTWTVPLAGCTTGLLFDFWAFRAAGDLSPSRQPYPQCHMRFRAVASVPITRCRYTKSTACRAITARCADQADDMMTHVCFPILRI